MYCPVLHFFVLSLLTIGVSCQRPVIIDTDIGSFLDDIFAIVFAAQSNDLDIKLVVTASDDTTARAKVTAKLLTAIGRDDIPIGIGVKNHNKTYHPYFDWAESFDLSMYKGTVYQDGIAKVADIILNSDTVVDIIAIAPMTNFPSLLSRYPSVVSNASIHAMVGSIYKGYDGSSKPVAEYNVALCPNCAEQMLSAKWDVTITPIDTCGTVRQTSDQVKTLLSGNHPASLGLAEALLYWCVSRDEDTCKEKGEYPVLFDPVATLLTLSNVGDFLEFQTLNLSVSSSAFTVIDSKNGASTKVALKWNSDSGESKFTDYLTNTLAGV